MSTKIISFINLKGGVAKTTTSINLAAVLSEFHNKKILVIDLDPQTNATIHLISQDEWLSRRENKLTLFNLFNDKLNGTSDFSIQDSIIKNVSDIEYLDLLPSSIDLININENLDQISTKGYINHIEVLKSEIDMIKDDYDFIFIDCAPNLGILTLNGVLISDYYIIPTIPDILSTLGLSQIQNRISHFKNRRKDCSIQLKGIIPTKVNTKTNLHKSCLAKFESNYGSLVFKSKIYDRIHISEAAGDSKAFIKSKTAQQKNSYNDISQLFKDAADELLSRI